MHCLNMLSLQALTRLHEAIRCKCDRTPGSLLPGCLDDFVAEDNSYL